ncbi:MAG: hypothetical protein QOI62_2373 [Solirubrobacteraceae bacterium]|nr:hypothetical protein [Solirubrobacteraceae bacterium]MEA2275212.1 hypothetical protein [Solirubrobacteraceae bacterium]MEA2359113.1 hypothetical protein [Solirubrobacteraceae bacterium]
MGEILLIGTFDTKGPEYAYVARRLADLGWSTVTIDVGVLGPARLAADVRSEDVAAAAGTSLAALVDHGDRGEAMMAMARGAEAVVRSLLREGRVAGALALGGSGGASVAAGALSVLPLGVPKLLVSTVVAGDTRPFVGDGDFTLMYPVVDLAGINRVTERVLGNAAAAIAGMARAHEERTEPAEGRPLIGLTMFGVTTPCVERVRQILAERDYEPLVFSANGVGGRSMERLVAEGDIVGVVDVTTTELADRLVGGILPAADGRLEAAGRLGLPQVVSVGALDVVNFGPWETVPERFRGRRLHRHNSAVTLMRTSPEEAAQLGAELAELVAGGRGPRAVVLPLRGTSTLSAPGGPFHDPDADAALAAALRNGLSEDVELIELDTHINDPDVATALAERFDAAYRTASKETVTT